MQLPRIGAPTTAAILIALGDRYQYTNGTQLVKLAGLHVRLFESGSIIKPSVLPEVEQTTAFVPVFHRFMKRGQRTAGPYQLEN